MMLLLPTHEISETWFLYGALISCQCELLSASVAWDIRKWGTSVFIVTPCIL